MVMHLLSGRASVQSQVSKSGTDWAAFLEEVSLKAKALKAGGLLWAELGLTGKGRRHF